MSKDSDFIFVIRGPKTVEPTYGYTYLENDAKKICEAPVSEYHYEKVFQLDENANYEIKDEDGDIMYLVFKEIGYGTFEDIGYTPDKIEAQQYVGDSSNLFVEPIAWMRYNDSMEEYLQKLMEEIENGED